MIAKVITDNSITFIAKGRPWLLAKDHPQYLRVRQALLDGVEDEDFLVNLTDVRAAVDCATSGEAVLNEEGLFFNGEQMSDAWAEKAKAAPDSLRSLLVSPGDQVRIEGDEDAPDGVYMVGDTDNEDSEKRVFVESDDGFLGFVANSSIREIIKGEVTE